VAEELGNYRNLGSRASLDPSPEANPPDYDRTFLGLYSTPEQPSREFVGKLAVGVVFLYEVQVLREVLPV